MPRPLSILRKAVLFLLGLAFFALLLFRSAAAMDGARRGLSLCTTTLLPALFPFLVFSELLVSSGAGTALGRYLGAPVRALFGLSAAGAAALLLGNVCGLPVATTSAAAAHARGELDERELRRLLLFSNNPSSGFLISATGVGLFGNHQAGVALLVITLASSALLGIALRMLFGKAAENKKTPLDGVKNELSVALFTESVQRAFSSFLRLCALVILFSALAEGLLDACASLSPLLRVLLHGSLEMTGGIAAASALLAPRVAFCAVAFLASFSGLCVCLQIFSIAPVRGVGAYLLARLAQGCIALALSLAYLRVFRPALTSTGSVSALSLSRGISLRLAALLFLTALALLLTALSRQKARKKARHTRA